MVAAVSNNDSESVDESFVISDCFGFVFAKLGKNIELDSR
jgi:hypothetical protein